MVIKGQIMEPTTPHRPSKMLLGDYMAKFSRERPVTIRNMYRWAFSLTGDLRLRYANLKIFCLFSFLAASSCSLTLLRLISYEGWLSMCSNCPGLIVPSAFFYSSFSASSFLWSFGRMNYSSIRLLIEFLSSSSL